MTVLELDGLNYGAVLVAWLINMIVGSLWYSPIGFGKQWSALSGVDMMKIPPKEAGRTIRLVAVSALVQALTLGILFHSLHVSEVVNGLLVGWLLWFGLVAATTVGTTLYQQKSWKFLWLNASYFLVVMTINSLILTVWR